MKYFPAVLLIFLIGACTVQKPIVTQEPENNHHFKVAYLFEYDGCKVYRFQDNGQQVYYTNCNGSVSALTDSTRIQTNVRAESAGSNR